MNDPTRWLEELAAFYDQLSSAQQGILLSHVDHDWQSKEQFLEYLADHIAITQHALSFLMRWEPQKNTSVRISFLEQDLAVSRRLFRHLGESDGPVK